MRSKRPSGHCRGCRAARPGRGAGPGTPGRGLGSSRGDIAGQHVAAPGEHPGEDPDGAAGFESAAVPGGREQRQADRVLRCSYQRSSKPQGSAAACVHGVEIDRLPRPPGPSSQQHLQRPGEARHDSRAEAPGPRRPRGRSAGWRTHRSPLPSSPRRPRCSVTWQACGQGTRQSPAWPSATSRSGSSASPGGSPGPLRRGGQHCHHAASSQDLIVGMGGDDHDAGPVKRVGGWEVLQPGPFVRGFLGGTWPVDTVRRDPTHVAAYHVGPLEATSSPS